MMQMAHDRYSLLFRQTHEMLTIHHFALLLFKNYLTIQLGMLQRIHHQYNRYESSLDDTLIGIESLSTGYLTHCILDPKVLARYQMTWKTQHQTMNQCSLMFTSIMVIHQHHLLIL